MERTRQGRAGKRAVPRKDASETVWSEAFVFKSWACPLAKSYNLRFVIILIYKIRRMISTVQSF